MARLHDHAPDQAATPRPLPAASRAYSPTASSPSMLMASLSACTLRLLLEAGTASVSHDPISLYNGESCKLIRHHHSLPIDSLGQTHVTEAADVMSGLL